MQLPWATTGEAWVECDGVGVLDTAGTLGTLLREHRLRSGMSQEHLAELADLSVRNLSDLERGINRSPRTATLRRIGDAMLLDEGDLAALIAAGSPSTSTTRRTATAAPGTPLATRLRSARVARGLTQQDLARRALISERAVSDLERGVNRTARAHTAVLLADALGLDSAERAVFLRLSAGLADDGGATTSIAPATAPSLPALPPIVGRARELASVTRLITESRLVTLTGPGGIGKTRIALEIADRWRRPPAVALLAEVPTGTELLTALAATLGVPDSDAEPSVALAAHLGDHDLLVIDNVEHLSAPGSGIARLLEQARTLRILATSRTPLHVPGERVEVIPPLDRTASVALFTSLIDAAGGIASDQPGGAATEQLCALLDDVPLAIELASGWIRLLPIGEIVSRLEDPLNVLRAIGSRPDERHASIRAAVAWSLDLLEPHDTELFRRLAVLPGSTTLAMVEDVVAGAGDRHIDVLVGMRALVDASLIQVVVDDGQPRARMLRPIAAVATELLREREDEATLLGQAHDAAVLKLAERAAPELIGSAQAEWFATLTREHHHLEAALDRLLAARSPDAVRLAAALWRYWYGRGHYALGQQRLSDALRLAEQTPELIDSEAWATAIYGRAVIGYLCGDVAGAETGGTEAIRRFRDIGAVHGECSAVNLVAMIQHHRGQTASARDLYRVGIERADAADAARAAATLRSNLATLVADEGNLADAMSLAEDAIARFQALGDSRAVADLLGSLGSWAAATADLPRARDLLHEAATRYAAIGDAQGSIDVERTLAEAALLAGAPAEATRRFEDVLNRAEELGDRWSIAIAHSGLALLAALAPTSGDSLDDALARANLALRIAEELEFREGQLHATVARAVVRRSIGDTDTTDWLTALDLALPGDLPWTLVAATGLAVANRDATLLRAAAAVPAERALIDPWPARIMRPHGPDGPGMPISFPEALQQARACRTSR